MNRLKKHFDHITRYDLLMKDHFVNVMETPYLNKIVLNIGLGQKLIVNRKDIVPTLLALELIGSQRAIVTRAKKSIDKFKLKKKMVIGSKVTLRRKNMFYLLDRLINDVLPNLENLEEFHKKYKKSLKSISKKRKNLNSLENSIKNGTKQYSREKSLGWNTGFGLEDFFSFKEIPYDKFDNSNGLDLALSLKQGYSSNHNVEKSSKIQGSAGLKCMKKTAGKTSFHLKGLSVNNCNGHNPELKNADQKEKFGFIKTVKNPGSSPYNYILSSFQLPLA